MVERQGWGQGRVGGERSGVCGGGLRGVWGTGGVWGGLGDGGLGDGGTAGEMADDLVVSEDLTIPGGELEFRATRAGGPGGQHVNTSATRVELLWNVAESRALPEEWRVLLLERLAKRLDAAGTLRIVAAVHRSQHRNRVEAMERLRGVVERALRPRRKRKRTAVPRREKEKRLREKKKRAELKRKRGRPRPEEE